MNSYHHRPRGIGPVWLESYSVSRAVAGPEFSSAQHPAGSMPTAPNSGDELASADQEPGTMKSGGARQTENQEGGSLPLTSQSKVEQEDD